MDTPLRLELYDTEKQVPCSVICVTGATGYVAGSIIQRLLAAGHTVHGTCRDPTDEKKTAHLKQMPGAITRLKVFKAELTDPGAFDAAVTGCRYVLHTASPVVMKVKKGEGMAKLVRPAVEGVTNVLEAATRVGGVKRIVLTSSVAAILGHHMERGKGHVFTDEDWNLTATEEYLPYFRSKMLAEKKAYELQALQKEWDVVTICPAVVLGPPSGNIKCESVGFMRQILNGKFWPASLQVGFGYCDVDDVAAAHTLSLFTKNASGRYIVVSESLMLPDAVNLLRPRFSRYWMPFLPAPYWLVWISQFVLPVDINFIKCTWKMPPQFDTRRVQEDLGLELTAVKKSMNDMAACLVALKVVPNLLERGSVKEK